MKRQQKERKENSATHIPAFLRPTEPKQPPEHSKTIAKQIFDHMALLDRKVSMLKDILFRLLARDLREGRLDATIYAELCCDQCREELKAMVEESARRKVH